MAELTFRPIRPEDNAAVASVIRAVMPEFGADGPGFAIHDPEVDHMAEAYAAPGAAFFVVVDAADRVIGGGGVAKLEGAEDGTCELRKMYFLPEARGTGTGERLLRHLIEVARSLGYRIMYLETLTGMDAAQKLYAKVGFKPLCAPMGATGHTSCDRWYAMMLSAANGGTTMKFEYIQDTLVLSLDENDCIQFRPQWVIDLCAVADPHLGDIMNYRIANIDPHLNRNERRLINGSDPLSLLHAVKNVDSKVLSRCHNSAP